MPQHPLISISNKESIPVFKYNFIYITANMLTHDCVNRASHLHNLQNIFMVTATNVLSTLDFKMTYIMFVCFSKCGFLMKTLE